MLKDIQEQIKKENDKKPSTDQIVASTKTSVTHVSPNQEAAEKKRRYEQAFCDEEVTSSSNTGSVEVANTTKKLKSCENSTNSIEQLQSDEKQQHQLEDNTSCASNSINDASDAISDEDYQLMQRKERDTIQKESSGGEDNAILVDDDCIIEENSNDLTNEVNSNENSFSRDTNNGNGVLTEEDDDIIECSGDEDVIEINDDLENNANEQSNGNKPVTYQLESNGNNHTGHLQVESENDSSSIEVFKHKKVLATNNLNGQNNNSTNGNGNGHLNTNSNGNGNGKHSTEEDDGVTLID